MRYEVTIKFTRLNARKSFSSVAPIITKCKTLVEAKEYAILVDETVSEAYVIDNTNNKKIIVWE